MSPNPVWVDIFRPASRGSGNAAGTATTGAVSERPDGVSGVANGTPAMKSRSAASPTSKPSNRSHSWPGRMPMAVRNTSICSFVIKPAWLSLWPAKGRPMPLTV